MTPAPHDTSIATLGPCLFSSPLQRIGGKEAPFKSDASDRILYHSHLLEDGRDISAPSYEEAGARGQIYFDPARTTAGIVTCGGLCPGLNDIIRGLVNQCHQQYGISRVYGFRYGYEGLVQRYGHTPLLLKPSSVEQAHHFGGTLLGSSRGQQDIGEMVDTLEDMKVDILFVIGGDEI
jgi:6-phosphofructokinase 1